MSDYTPLDPQALALRLKEAREYVGLTQEQAAAAIGMPRASLSALEAGKRKVFANELPKFAALYRVGIDALMHDAPMEPDPRDEAMRELFRQVAALCPADRETVLRFAYFLKHAGRPPTLALSKCAEQEG